MAKFLLLENEELVEVFDSLNELEEYLDDDFEGGVEDLRVYEFDTEYTVTRKHDLEEV